MVGWAPGPALDLRAFARQPCGMDTFTGTKHRISSSKLSTLFIYTSGTPTTSTYFASMVLYAIPEGWRDAGAFTTKTFQASDSGRALSEAQAWVRREFKDPAAKFVLDRPFDLSAA